MNRLANMPSRNCRINRGTIIRDSIWICPGLMGKRREYLLVKKSPNWARVFGHFEIRGVASTFCPRGFSPGHGSAKFTSREYYDLSMLESVPRFAKIVIPLLTILNLLLLVWIYEEYLHNRFLRIY